MYINCPCVYMMCAMYNKCEISVTVQMCNVQGPEILNNSIKISTEQQQSVYKRQELYG